MTSLFVSYNIPFSWLHSLNRFLIYDFIAWKLKRFVHLFATMCFEHQNNDQGRLFAICKPETNYVYIFRYHEFNGRQRNVNSDSFVSLVSLTVKQLWFFVLWIYTARKKTIINRTEGFLKVKACTISTNQLPSTHNRKITVLQFGKYKHLFMTCSHRNSGLWRILKRPKIRLKASENK